MAKGYIIKQKNGRYGVILKELSCGCPLSIMVDGKLIDGRIEHDGDDYYFLDKSKIKYKLIDDMEVLFD